MGEAERGGVMAGREASALGYRPLYRQVREALEKRIAAGFWQAGQALPSEPELALDLGVSQGTVRKALDEMTAENLVVRRQGRGTFVASHDDDRVLFQFFKLVPDEGPRSFPDSRVIGVETGKASAAERVALALAKGDGVIRIDRVRSVEGIDCILERIVLPRSRFPGLEKRALPNNLYQLYAAAFSVTIARATERLKAVAADERQGSLLGVAPGAPLLSVDRIAWGLDGTRAEWRVSVCRTDAMHYLSELR